jgi:uncharacterized protein YcbX
MFHVLGAIGNIFNNNNTSSNEDKSSNPETKDAKSPREERKALDDGEEGIVDTDEYEPVTVTELIVYPCKGAKGINLQSAKITMTGFELDREWFVLEKDFDINQDPKVVKRTVSLTKNDLVGVVEPTFREENGRRFLSFSHPNMSEDLVVDVDNPPTTDPYMFYNTMMALVTCFSEGKHADKWFSEAIDRDVVFVRSQQR